MDGHWCCLTKNKGEISFFDPYGEIVDKQLKYSQFSKDRVEGGADLSLHQLLSTSKLPVFYNDFKYQRDGNAVNTCGRHAINFIRYNQRHGLDLEDYNEMMEKAQKQSGLPYDELIAKLVPVHLPKEGEAPIVGSAKPTDPELYEEAKAIVYPRYKKPSAYRSGALVKEYKKMGGTFEDEPNDKKPLKRWFKEEWADVGGLDYPTYRPTKRITEDTPLTASEISPEELAKQAILKQKIKGNKNLPAFKGKGRPLNSQNKTCAEKFLECVDKKLHRKVRGKDARYNPEVKIKIAGRQIEGLEDLTNPHLADLASLAITGKKNYDATKLLIEKVKEGMTPDERTKQKEITQEDLQRVKHVKPYKMKSAAKHRYNLARALIPLTGEAFLEAIKRGKKQFPSYQVPYEVKGRNKDGRIIISFEKYGEEGDEMVEVMLPLIVLYQENKRPARLFDPEDGTDLGMLYAGKRKEKRKGATWRGVESEYEVDVDDPAYDYVKLDMDWLRETYKQQIREKALEMSKKGLERMKRGEVEPFDPDADYEAKYIPEKRLWYVKDADNALYYIPPSKFPHSDKSRKVRVSEEYLVDDPNVIYVGRLNKDGKTFTIEREQKRWWFDYKAKHNIK